jgi:four helix bundle protein
MARNFDLEDRTLKFAKRVIQWCQYQSLKTDSINRGLIDQAVRASGSIGANYREANDALSKKDFGHPIRITRKEAKEAHYWIELLMEANRHANGEGDRLLQEALKLKKILCSIAQKLA